jgi:hypothetical protein
MLLHAFGEAFTSLLTSSPLVAVVVVIAVLVAVTGFVRHVIHGGHSRDPIRRFTRQDKTTLLALAWHRCEHHYPLHGRCKTTDRLEADHIHPWSRGGQTAIANGQSCATSTTRRSAPLCPLSGSSEAERSAGTSATQPASPAQ